MPATGGSVYYTTDGTIPSPSNGTLYAGPSAITVPANTTVQVRAMSTADPSFIGDAHFRNYGFKPADPWYPTNFGIPVQAFSGGITGPIGGRYYTTGQWMYSGTNYEPFSAVYLYSTADFYNWQFDRKILDVPSPWDQVTRSHVLYNAATSKYVLWAHCDLASQINNPAYNRACVGTASSITGPWTWQNTSLDPDGVGFKDDNLFLDNDGTAYVTYTNGSQYGIVVSQLAADFLTTTGAHVTANGVAGRESPVLFRRNSTYFLISGDASTYNLQPTDIHAGYQTASSPLGTWSASSPLFAVDPVNTPYNGQPCAVFKMPGTTDGWIFMADLWTIPTTNTTHLWLPLTFPTDSSAQVLTPAVWDLSSLI